MAKQPNIPKGGAGRKQPPDNASPDGAPDAGPGTIPAAEPVNMPPQADKNAKPDEKPEAVQTRYIARTVIRYSGKEYNPGDILPETADDKTIDELLALSAICASEKTEQDIG